MFKCTKCNAEFAENKNFCEFCGAQLEAVEAPVAEAPVASTEPVVDPYVAVDNADVVEPAKKAFSVKKLLGIAIPVVAVVIVAAILLSMFVFKKSAPSYIFYQKDGELWFSKASKIAPREISKDLNESGTSVKVSNDGKYIFFYDNGEEGADDLYYVKAGDKKAEPKKIDTDVSSYVINKSGTIVTYIKDGGLYQHNLKERRKIAADVSDFYVDIDGKNIYYIVSKDGDTDLYLKNGKKDAKKLASDVVIKGFNKKFDTVYYIVPDEKDEDDESPSEIGTLYKQTGTKDKVKISADVYDTLALYESGDLYFVTAVVEEKEDEDGYKSKNLKKTLNFYNGKDVKKITESYDSRDAIAYDAPVIVYSTVEGEGEDAETKFYAAIEDTANEISTEKDYYYGFNITADGKTIYYTATKELKYDDYESPEEYQKALEEQTSEIFSIAVSGKKLKKAESYDKDVTSYVSITEENQVVYYKDQKDDKGTLYIDKKKVADDVFDWSYYEEIGGLLYRTDKTDDGDYTLYTYVKGKSKKVSDEVHSRSILPNGDIIYLKDYEKGKGTLYLYNGSKSTKVDEDVSGIIGFSYIQKDQVACRG